MYKYQQLYVLVINQKNDIHSENNRNKKQAGSHVIRENIKNFKEEEIMDTTEE